MTVGHLLIAKDPKIALHFDVTKNGIKNLDSAKCEFA